MKAKIEERIAEIEKALQNTVAYHAELVGHLAEAKHLLELAKAEEEPKAVEVEAELV